MCYARPRPALRSRVWKAFRFSRYGFVVCGTLALTPDSLVESPEDKEDSEMVGDASETPSKTTTRENSTSTIGELTDDFTQFQLKEYENISQAHFKTNEVLATFYRYFLLITAIPITTIGLALLNFSNNGISDEGRIFAYILFGVSAVLLSLIGAAVISYIEGLRLNAILYARVVNSIRDFFFKKPGADLFGESVLPTSKDKPSYDGFGASFIMYLACAFMNSAYFGAGLLALILDKRPTLENLKVEYCQWTVAIGGFLFLLIIQFFIRRLLILNKYKKG